MAAIAPAAGAIVKGQGASVAYWPFVVQVRHGGALCGGTIVAPGWVLTAGHCVVGGNGGVRSPGSIAVVADQQEYGGEGGQSLPVQRVIPHPQFARAGNPRVPTYDVALLQLVRRGARRSIPLAGPRERERWRAGAATEVVGWGDPRNTLHRATLPVASHGVCRERWGNRYDPRVMLCAGYAEAGRADACSGDSGGPLMADSPSGHWQVGVVSYGSRCGKTGGARGPALYARVGEGPLRSWIVKHVGQVIRVGSQGKVRAIGDLTFGDGSRTDVGDAYEAFGRPSLTRGPNGSCLARWDELDLTVYALKRGDVPRDASACHRGDGFVWAADVGRATKATWQTDRGLAPGSTQKDVLELYPGAHEEGQGVLGLLWARFGSRGANHTDTLLAQMVDGRVWQMRAIAEPTVLQ